MAHPRWRDLEQLTEDGRDPAAVLAIATLDQLAEAWCAYHSRAEPRPDDEPNWWAVDFFLSGIWELLEEHRPLLRAALEALLRKADPDPRLCGFIGAGPLENFLPQTEDDFGWLEALAVEVPGTRIAVGAMWVDDWLSAEQMDRLDRIADKPLNRSVNESR
jgi:hypothetical protein